MTHYAALKQCCLSFTSWLTHLGSTSSATLLCGIQARLCSRTSSRPAGIAGHSSCSHSALVVIKCTPQSSQGGLPEAVQQLIWQASHHL